jgi:hypothetical protein
MIVEAIVRQFVQRFQHEKRAQVCLWFDEKEEFRRLLPALRHHLDDQTKPPFRLLEYDEEARRGQIWVKYQIYQAVQAAPSTKRKQLRFVVHVPLSEDRLDRGGPDGTPPLDLLAEYRLTGIIWRIGGKRPTLFSFLRQAGVPLPDSPGEQRQLFDGGADSLLAKYAAKFWDRPATFWATPLTAELAQSRLVGDADQALLDLAIDPEGSWAALAEKGLARELLDMVQDRYGFDAGTAEPAEWMRDFVTQLALTETFRGYGEPADFPFTDRLPPEPLRPYHEQLLRRWLRDAESRGAWDRWIQEVEAQIDLSSWARGRRGLSFSFPHLVRLRWEDVREAFEGAAPRTSSVTEFFEAHGKVITKEAEFAQASHAPVGAWALLRDLEAFLRACERGRSRAESLSDPGELTRAYVEGASGIELQHLRIRFLAEERGLPAASQVADRAYAEYANALNDGFFLGLLESGQVEVSGVAPVTTAMAEQIWHVKGPRAVVIVDALRYDCALAVREQLREQEVAVEPLLAALPTVTPVGMTALLPISDAAVTVEVKRNNVHPKVNGKDTAVLSNRIAYLREFGATCLEIAEAEARRDAPDDAGDLLVVFGHDDVDQMGHGEAQTLVRHIQLEVDRIVRLVRKLHRWGYPTVHLVTDHGFILLDESRLPPEVRCEKDWCHVLKARFAMVPAEADLPVASFPFPWDSSMRVAVPPGLAFFKAEKAFSHGGASLQELVIPHLVSRSQVTTEKRIAVEVVLPTYELMRTAVKVVLRPKEAEPSGAGQMGLFSGTPRTLALDVFRSDGDMARKSVLAGDPKEVRLEPNGQEQNVTLFFHTAASFRKGDLLELEIRDVDTAEQFPPGGIKLTVGRDM